uniref:M23ase beta-sheet core domain-containing protein n=2 Tax=Guillardia theta TaxID=55529 RepID=A0A6U6B9I5_GUITH|mmetsp:Transcript_36805/g.115099  ORF Transcript_36805/g.115099 Transcript_36805/m.115099 type:complete len:215 (+) Transcript_36805:429-1073(+)
MPYRERGYFVRDFTGGETSTTMLLRVRRWIGQMFPVLQGKMDIGRYNEMRPAMYERLLQSVDRVQGFDGLRNIHVGIDIGAAVGTPIRSFFDGRVYKFGFNPSPGDYGHVIVTEHNINGHRVWALYGHLSAKSMSRLYEGKEVRAGDLLAFVGGSDENGGWPPHLHFQLSLQQPTTHDMPGVVAKKDHDEALRLFPDPQLVLGRLYPGDGPFLP